MPDLQANRLLDWVGKVPVDKDAVDFFSANPGVKPYVADSKFEPVPFYSRIPKNDAEDTFFAETIKSPQTIPRALLLLRSDIAHLRYDFETGPAAAGEEPDTVALVQIGSKLNGYRDTIHGGMLASLLDEAVGFNVDALCSCAEAQEKKQSRARLYTAYLNTTYKRPAQPGVYAVESRLVKRDGRKWYLKGRIVGDDGAVYTEADVLYIRARDGAL